MVAAGADLATSRGCAGPTASYEITMGLQSSTSRSPSGPAQLRAANKPSPALRLSNLWPMPRQSPCRYIRPLVNRELRERALFVTGLLPAHP